MPMRQPSIPTVALLALAVPIAHAQHCTSWCHWDWPTHCAPGKYFHDCAGCKECKDLVATGAYTPSPATPPILSPPNPPPQPPPPPPPSPPPPSMPPPPSAPPGGLSTL